MVFYINVFGCHGFCRLWKDNCVIATCLLAKVNWSTWSLIVNDVLSTNNSALSLILWFLHMFYNISSLVIQGCHGQGKVREIPVFPRVREKSGNSAASQGILHLSVKVREKSGNFVCGPHWLILFIDRWMIFGLEHNQTLILIKMWHLR